MRSGLVTAAGGGTLRDLLLGKPVFWVSDQSYVLVALAAAMASFSPVALFVCRQDFS